MRKGSFGVGIFHPKKEENIGGLMRSAWLYGASYVFTIGKRYSVRQSSDTPNVLETLPVFHYKSFSEFYENMPINAELIGIELDEESVALNDFSHPENAVYLLGAEDAGLSQEVRWSCDTLVQVPSFRPVSNNVAVAGSIVLYDRFAN